MKKLLNLSIILVMLLGLLPARAAIAEVTPLWEQLPNGEQAELSVIGQQLKADNFYLTETTSIARIEIWSNSAGPYDLTFDIYADTIDGEGYHIPGALVHSEVIYNSSGEEDEICPLNGDGYYYCKYRYTLSFDPSLELAAGDYWLSVYGSAGSNFGWSRADIPSQLTTYASKIEPNPWNGQYSSKAFAFRLLEPQETCDASVVVVNTNDSGAGSLRQAIADVCAGGTITFDSSLDIEGGATITLSSELILDKNLTIDGSTLINKVSISGNSLVRGFIVTTGNTVTLDSLVITAGKNDNGGGIYNGGTLTINNCRLFANTGLIGGGIINHGTLSITDSTLSQNTASNGGALTNWGTATLTNCTISGNQAAAGAGIDVSGGTLTVTDSTISGNSATQRGGGIIVNSGTVANIFGSTFVNNTAGNMGGGGIMNMGTTSVINSTFTGNVTGSEVRGSAINNTYSGGNLTLYNSTLSGNTGFVTLNNENSASMSLANTIIANTTSGWDCSNYHGTIAESLNNWVSDGATGDACGATNFGDPMLGALADNGGPTQTMALLEGSPAIDAGDDAICAASPVNGVDQRGVTRPQGAHCDIGAFELDLTPYLWQQLPDGVSAIPSYNADPIIPVLYEDFVFAETKTIRQVEFWSSTAEPVEIYFGFYKNTIDDSGKDIPDTTQNGMLDGGGVGRSTVALEDAAICSSEYCTYRHSFGVGTMLPAGRYWLKILGATELYWSSAAGTPGNYAKVNEYSQVTLIEGNLAFRLLEFAPPKVTSIYISPEPSMPGRSVWGSVSYHDPDTSASITCEVDWGDGITESCGYCSYGNCWLPEHTFTTAGLFTVQVTLTDSDGMSGTGSIQHRVSYVSVPYPEDWLASNTHPTMIELEGYAAEGYTPLIFKIVDEPAQGTMGTPTSSVCEFDAEDGFYRCTASVVYTPISPLYTGEDSFGYTVDDGLGNVSSTATVRLWVRPNAPPTAQDLSATVSTVQPGTIMLTATDPDFYEYTIDRLSISNMTDPTHGTLTTPEKVDCYLNEDDPENPFGYCLFKVVFTPNPGVTAETDSFTFTVFDTHQDSLAGMVSLTLRAPGTLVVNATDDDVDDDGCDSTHCSLREAIEGSISDDIIEFDLGEDPATIELEHGKIVINKDLTIVGPGADQVTIDGNEVEQWDNGGVFELEAVWSQDLDSYQPIYVKISGLTIIGGRARAGGGIYNGFNCNLELSDCVIGPNNIVFDAGGGLANVGGSLYLNRCTVMDNHGTGSIGGAGIFTYNGADTTLKNSTVTGNVTNNHGGGILVWYDSAVHLVHSTVTGNTANADYVDYSWGGGGGIYAVVGDDSDPGGKVYIQNSIVAGNIDVTEPDEAKLLDVYGNITSWGGNLIGDGTGTNMESWLASDQVGTAAAPINPLLAELVLNSPGTTPTHALLTGSPAINAVECAYGVTVDQRGVTRPQGDRCDIGAYELEQTVATGSLKISKVFDPLTSGFTGTFTIFYDCGGVYWAYVTLGAGASQTFTDIPIGSQCTVSESSLPTPPPGWSFGTPTFSPSNTVTIGETLAEVVVTNTIVQNPPETGELKITKSFDPLTSGFTETFAIAYDCDDGTAHDGTVYLAAAGSQTISGIPLGTICTVTEDTLPTPPTGWSFGLPTFAPETGAVTINEASPAYAEVIVTNTISRDLGELKISKVFDPLTSGYFGTFTINYDCDDGTTHDGTVNLSAGGSTTISGIPTGTQCAITEPNLPSAPTGWTFGEPSYYPESGIVTITANTLSSIGISAVPVGAEVTVYNTISRDLGELKISKIFNPLTSGFDSTFAINYVCDDGVHSGTVTLGAGGSQTISGIPTGTTCTVTETTLPTAPTGWSFEAATFDPVDGMVTIGGTPVEVTVTNTISQDAPEVGELKISKVFDPLTSGFTGDFTITYDCDDGTAHDGTVYLAAGESATIIGIPTGTTCWVSEGELPTAPEGWEFTWPIYNPKNGAVIINEVSPAYAEVTVTNYIQQVLGELKISKVFDPLTSDFIDAFTISYDCDGETHDGTVNLTAGTSQTISGIPTGTTCTVTETTLPTAPMGWTFGTPIYNPTDGTVTISETLAEVTVTNTISQDSEDDLSQITTARAKCTEFAAEIAPDQPNLFYTYTFNKKIGEDVIKSVTPSTFQYYVKATLPPEASTLVIAQKNDHIDPIFPAMGASVTLYDANCVRLSPQLASVSITDGDITINFVASESERVVYVAVKYSAKPIIGQIVTGWPDILYTFSAALDGSKPFTSADLPVVYIQ